MQEYIYMLFKKDIFEEAPKNSEHKLYWKHTDKKILKVISEFTPESIYLYL